MSSNGRPITQTYGYQAKLENDETSDEGTTGHAKPNTSITSSPPPVPENSGETSNPPESRLPRHNHDGNDVTVSRDEKLARAIPNRSYHHLMTIEQAGPSVIGVDDTDRRKRVAIKRVRKPEGSVHQVPQSTCDQIVNIKDMYVENGDVVFVYEQMDVSLRHMTGILQDQPLKAFQIAAIWRELVSGLLYIHEEFGLAHGALNCSTILLDINGRVKIANVGDSFIEKRRLTPDSRRNDICSLGGIMMELMEPTTYILDAQSRKLKDSDKWKNSLGIEDFLAATCHKSLQELKEAGTVKAGTVKAVTVKEVGIEKWMLSQIRMLEGATKSQHTDHDFDHQTPNA